MVPAAWHKDSLKKRHTDIPLKWCCPFFVVLHLAGNDESRTTEGETVLAWCCWCWANFAKRTVFSITNVETYHIQHLSKSLERFKDFKKSQEITCTILYHLVALGPLGPFGAFWEQVKAKASSPQSGPRSARNALTVSWLSVESWEKRGENLYDLYDFIWNVTENVWQLIQRNVGHAESS